ncbi:hypothetical protein [Polaribacter batillariae]|uniref:hypothetical protein n=1 Tax=Polaribacter batillariae TaxID=2808900 RepID=UPI001FB14961|nr:hypothetical protein [Polaribacter batillariae]
MAFTPKNKNEFALDVFGSKVVMHQLEDTVRTITQIDKNTDLSIGYVLGNTKKANKFEFKGVQFSSLFIISRFIWMIIAIGLVGISSLLFHRFSLKKKLKSSKKKKIIHLKEPVKEVNLSELIATKTNYSIFPLIKTEFLLLVRKGKKWLWFINIIGMVLLGVLALEIAHTIVLPILWFYRCIEFRISLHKKKPLIYICFLNLLTNQFKGFLHQKLLQVFYFF